MKNNILFNKNDEIYKDFRRACFYNDHKTFLKFIKNENNLNAILSIESERKENEKNWPTLHLACYRPNSFIINLLLKNRFEKVNKKYSNWTPIEIACYFGSLKTVEMLLNKISNNNDISYNLLKISVINQNEEMINTILSSSNININRESEEENKWTILHFCSSNNNYFKLLKYIINFIEYMRNDINIDYSKKDSNGNTAIHVAIQFGNSEIAIFLLNKVIEINKINEIKNKNVYGWNILHLACQSGLYSVLKKILKMGIIDINSITKNENRNIDDNDNENVDENDNENDCKTSLQIACENGNLDIVKLLIRYGADLKIKINYWNALHYSIYNYNIETTKYLHKLYTLKDDYEPALYENLAYILKRR